MRTLAALVLLSTAAGCPAESPRLFVDVITDYAPGRNFTIVRTELWRGDDETAMRDTRSIERDVLPDDEFLEGVRVAEIDDAPPGTATLRVSLMTDDGRRIADRVAIVHLDGDVGVTVLITRDCASAACPPADEPNLTACFGGRCIAPDCLPETPEACADGNTDAGVPEPDGGGPGVDGGDADGGAIPPTEESRDCTSAADCTTSVACAITACVEGLCLTAPDDDLCGSGTICDETSGCVPTPYCGDTTCDAGESYCDCTTDCDDRCGGGCCTGSDVGGNDDEPIEDPPPPPPPDAPTGPGSCVVECCDGVTTNTTQPDANACRLDYERCRGHGKVLTMEFEGFRIYTRDKPCIFCCALCRNRLRYHRVEGIVRGCTLAAEDYCHGTRGPLRDADWRDCQL